MFRWVAVTLSFVAAIGYSSLTITHYLTHYSLTIGCLGFGSMAVLQAAENPREHNVTHYPLTVHSLSAHCPLTIRSLFAGDALQQRSQGLVTERTRTPGTVRRGRPPPSGEGGPLGVRAMVAIIACVWQTQLRQRIAIDRTSMSHGPRVKLSRAASRSRFARSA